MRPENNRTNINNKIRSLFVLLIDEKGNNLGKISTKEALQRAINIGLDLVEVNNGKVPVCRIMDYGKWKYTQSKRIKKNTHQKQQQQTKEIKFRPNTGNNDLLYRAKQANKFLNAGNKVKLVVRFRGRELEHKYDTGKALLERFLAMVNSNYNIPRYAVAEGKCIILIIEPVREK